jgi:hypothetical protein
MSRIEEITISLASWIIAICVVCFIAWGGCKAYELIQEQSGGIVSEGQP